MSGERARAGARGAGHSAGDGAAVEVELVARSCGACGAVFVSDELWCGDCLDDYRQVSGVRCGEGGWSVEGFFLEDRPDVEDGLMSFMASVRRALDGDEMSEVTAIRQAVRLFGSSDPLDAWVTLDAIESRSDDGALVLRQVRRAVESAIDIGILVG